MKRTVRKTVRQMGSFVRGLRSLGGKTIRAIIILSAVIGISALIFAFLLYASAVNRQYETTTWNISRTAANILDLVSIRNKATQVLDIYDSLSEEERLMNETQKDQYLNLYASVHDMELNSLRWSVHELQLSNDVIAGYIAAFDLEHHRMIFIADGDQNSTCCQPGYWDLIKKKDMENLVEGNKPSLLDKMNGAKSMNATITNMPQYGYRCTAGTKVCSVNGYPVYIFFDSDMNIAEQIGRTFLWQFLALLAIVAFVTGIFIYLYLKKRIVKPINQLAEAAEGYIKDKKGEEHGGRHFEALDIDTGDEIENLFLTMQDMERDLDEYVDDLTKVTAEKERISTELNVAEQIQKGMVPHIYPAFPDRTEFDIYATMHPAKEVGGDFYDYFLIDEDHLAVVMADVSGKGIPAALFMMASKIMINNNAILHSGSPAAILELVNNSICQNNSVEMFVTVWLGILELSTGKLLAANAGHEFPALRRAGGEYELFRDKHGFVIGGMENVKYKDYEIDLNPGDGIFQYTDGVTEATNAEQELFGTDRMLEALNKNPEANPEEVLANVHEGIDAFVKDAPQFDDITMLALVYKGK